MTSQEIEYLMRIIKGRRSIRKYKEDPVPDKALEIMLEAARWAPNGENFQPWRFIIVRDRETIRKIGLIGARASGRRFLQQYMNGALDRRFAKLPKEKREKIIKKMIEGRVSGFVGTAPVLIAACGLPNVGVDMPMDLAAATQNLCLAAHALGLGACWVIGATKDPRDGDKVEKLLGVPEDAFVHYVIAMGYPDEFPNPRPRKPLADIVYSETYGVRFFEESTEAEPESL